MLVFIITISLFLIGLLCFMWYKANHEQIDYLTIHLDRFVKSDEALKLFFISDIHKRVINNATLNKIEENINIVIIGGDLLERGVSFNQVKTNIELLKTFNAPIYFVWGNNDYETNDQRLTKLLKENKVTILKNNSVNFSHGSNLISLVGIDCLHMGVPNFEKALENAEGKIKILLTHDPHAFYECSDYYRTQFDLVLSGHTHGGQIRILGFGPYTNGGCRLINGIPVFVSEGYGYTKLPLRLGTTAECHVIEISPS